MVTGASGLVGKILIDGLADEFELYGLDLNPKHGTRVFKVDIAEPGQLEAVLSGLPSIYCIVHLAADPRVDAPWDSILRTNIVGTANVYEAAKRFGIPRVVFASSNHATGAYEGIPPQLHTQPQPALIRSSDPIAPDSYYGVSKAFGEALARFFCEVHGIHSICLRIGTVLQDDDPTQHPRFRKTWLSHRDLLQLVKLSIRTADKFRVFYGVSNNKGSFWDISDARQVLGYDPQDDASLQKAP